MAPEQFVALAGAGIVDRLREGGGVILCDWESLRPGAVITIERLSNDSFALKGVATRGNPPQR